MKVSFKECVKLAKKHISSVQGYLGHTIIKCLEAANGYLHVDQWQTLENQKVGFQKIQTLFRTENAAATPLWPICDSRTM